MARMALLKPVLNQLGKLGKASPVARQLGQSLSDPQTVLARYGLDGGFALMAGTVWAPEDATLAERAALMGEDLVYGVGASLVGQTAGGLRGARKYRKAREANKPITATERVKGPDGKVVKQERVLGQEEVIDRNMGYGDMIAMPAMTLLPRPIAQGVYEQAGVRAQQSDEQVAAAEQEMNEQQMLAASVLSGGQGVLAALYPQQFGSGMAAGPGTIDVTARNLTA